jgi:hypothetical protein
MIVKILILIICCLLGLILGGCFKKPKPEPEPEPEDKWEDYYPAGWYKPLVDINAYKWQEREIDTDLWWEYENKLIEFMRIQGRDIFDALALARVLTIKINGQYYFKWTSDMETWQQEDYWATPPQFVIEKKGKGDCDEHSGLHCDYLYRLCKLWLVKWLEIYWKKRYWNSVSNSYQWKNLGHAITIFKETPESPWKCFSNQQFLGMTNGYQGIGEIVSKFCPKDDNHELIKVVARHPITGDLLWVIDKNHGGDELLLTIEQLKDRKEIV